MEQIIKADYAQAVKAIKQAIVVCRYRAARQMNGEVLGLYYSIGKYISEQSRNAQWGTNAIQTISDQLQQELPGLKGFSEKNIRKMRQFYEEWCEVFEIHSAVPNEISIMPQSAEIQPFTFCLFKKRRRKNWSKILTGSEIKTHHQAEKEVNMVCANFAHTNQGWE